MPLTRQSFKLKVAHYRAGSGAENTEVPYAKVLIWANHAAFSDSGRKLAQKELAAN